MHKALVSINDVSIKDAGITIVFKHVPAHIGIYGNERLNRLTIEHMISFLFVVL